MRPFVLSLSLALAFACNSTSTSTRDAAPGAVMSTDAELAPRLEKLIGDLEERREALHLPGMAIAVVRGDEVILARGFGEADLETDRPATPETIFAVGSTTKAFTTALLATLVDQGALSWDDPISYYLPYFTPELETDDPDAALTLADLCSHRSGFTRMGILWASGQVGREDILRTAATAEPWAGYREGFHYNNVMFLAAGQAAGVAAGSTWDELLRARLIEPLGMNATTLTVHRARQDPRLALGYVWDDDLEEHRQVPMRELDSIGPAGSINSNVLDMSRWLMLLLDRGEYHGQRIIQPARFEELWSSKVDIGGGIAYGLGWMLRDWEGRQIVEHGGNIDGFAAQVALVPEEDLGFVLLTNVGVTPLQQESISMVFEALLGEDQIEESVADASVQAVEASVTSREPYLGEYEGSIGGIAGKDLTVLEENGAMAVDVPGQMVYRLNEPDEEGRWVFKITSAIAVSFTHVEQGQAQVLVMHQNGMDIECPRHGFEYPVEVPLEELEPFVGRYQFEMDEEKFMEVVLKNNHLAIDVPGQTQYELHLPDESGARLSRMTPEFGARFGEEDGRVVSMTLLERGEEMACRRVDVAAPPPSLEELHALRGSERRSAAIAAAGGLRMVARARFEQAGVEGTHTSLLQGLDRVSVRFDLGRFGFIESVVREDAAFERSSFEPYRELTGDRLRQTLHGTPAAAWGDWREVFDGEEIIGRGNLRGRETLRVVLTDGDLPPAKLDIDAETGDILRWREDAVLPGLGQLPVESSLFDYREVSGMSIPFRVEVSNDANGTLTLELQSVDVGQEFPADTFVLVPQ